MFKKRKIISVIFALCLVFSFVCTYPSETFAKTNNSYVAILHKVNTARENYPIRYNFSLEKASEIYFQLAINERTSVALTVKNQRDEVAVKSDTLPSTDPRWKYNEKSGIYENKHLMQLPAGDYILEMNFETEVNYDLNLSRVSEKVELNYSNLDLTTGFSKQLKVNKGKIKSCSTSNKNIATVSNSGRITAKKIGKATIKVKLSDGKTLSCKVNVKENKYSAKEIAIANVVYNTSEMKAYAASFDSKGNLVVKFKLVNNSYGKITKVSKFKVNIKDASKKGIASFSKSTYKTNVASYSDKACIVTIPKSSLKKDYKNIDIRTAKITITGEFADASL